MLEAYNNQNIYSSEITDNTSDILVLTRHLTHCSFTVVTPRASEPHET